MPLLVMVAELVTFAWPGCSGYVHWAVAVVAVSCEDGSFVPARPLTAGQGAARAVYFMSALFAATGGMPLGAVAAEVTGGAFCGEGVAPPMSVQAARVRATAAAATRAIRLIASGMR